MASLLAGPDRPRGAAVLSRCLLRLELISNFPVPAAVTVPRVMAGQRVGGVATEFVQGYRGSMTLGATVRLLGRYRPGRRVTVYYDPAHPHLAVLEPRASLGGLVRVLISGAVVWAGLRVFYGSRA